MVEKFAQDLFEKHASTTNENLMLKLRKDFRRYNSAEEEAIQWVTDVLGLRVVIMGKSQSALQEMGTGANTLVLSMVGAKDPGGHTAHHFSYIWTEETAEFDFDYSQASLLKKSFWHWYVYLH